jgi:hypothetical protein
VSQSSIQLAGGAISPNGDRLTVEYVAPVGKPSFIGLRWPPKPTAIAPTPQGLADVATAVVGLLATAQTRFAQLRANGQL